MGEATGAVQYKERGRNGTGQLTRTTGLWPVLVM